MTKSIAIACDHAGLDLKNAIKAAFPDLPWLDLGTHTTESVDYPDYGHKMAEAIKAGEADRGILICGSGVGISIAANRHPHIRCALVSQPEVAAASRWHNDANVLALGARFTGLEVAKTCVEAFLNTAFEGGRHQKRVDKLSSC
ncbi:MAG: ribose 5-phosphate isomerase B [Proteobacteria bacterium]|nr:ribose 5-phosphate isomerase B [Pseudomonadota bacterium]